MLGLFGSLSMASRSLQTQRQGVEVAGHNLANVNNPAYARQRLNLSATSLSGANSQGNGVTSASIIQVRSQFLDGEVQTEQSVRGSLESRQQALEQAQGSLGDLLANDASGAGGRNLGSSLTNLFNGFANIAANPGSVTDRQTMLGNAASLATQFNQADQRLAALSTSLDASLKSDVASANGLLTEIANLSNQIARTEGSSDGAANDLRDAREQKLEDLSHLLKLEVSDNGADGLQVAAGGITLIAGGKASAELETYDAGNGQLLVRTKGSAGPLGLTSGSLAGTIAVRDEDVAGLRKGINTLASTLITEVNRLHAAGASLTGSTGAEFFTGKNAGDIGVNQALLNDPRLVQLAGAGGGSGDNQTALSIAALADQPLGALGNAGFTEKFTQQATAISQALSETNAQLEDQDRVDQLLSNQRSSVSGVSIDEEMTDMMKFQKAFEASAKLMNTIDEMLDTVINLKR